MDSYKLISNYYGIVTEQGLCQDIELEILSKASSLIRAIFISQICWVVVSCTVKYSILAFYWRLFSANHRVIRVTIWALAASVTCWAIAAVRFRLLVCWGFPSGRYSRLLNDILAAYHILSRRSCQFGLALQRRRSMSCW